MAKEINLRIAGEAGQGMKTIGDAVSMLFKAAGFNIFGTMDYMSRIRGGNNFFQLRVSSEPVGALREKADVLLPLDKNSIALHLPSLAPGGLCILDREQFQTGDSNPAYYSVPLFALARAIDANEVYINTVACGVILALTGLDFSLLESVLRTIFAAKGAEVVEKNLRAAKAGYEYIGKNTPPVTFPLTVLPDRRQLAMNGNEALALGAIAAGCKFYSAYPMTPSTTVMETVAHYAARCGIVVEQAEDEIAAINMAIGASFAGVRAMTGTSGGGFALMVEGVSLAGMTETPVVIVESQRPGPATGFPTRTEQSDLEFVVHAGHGEFARAVFAPGTIEECFALMPQAFNLAEKYQIPVFVLTDQHLADSIRNIDPFPLQNAAIERHILPRDDSNESRGYKRYRLTDSGVSPRAVPSWIADPVYADSDEHTEAGHITEDAGIRRQMVEKRFYRKMEGVARDFIPPTIHNPSAETMLLCFGSTRAVVAEACRARNDPTLGWMHFAQVFPLPAEAILPLTRQAKRLVTVENNAGAQLSKLLRRETGLRVQDSILKYDGRPFYLEELMRLIQERKDSWK
jgi:2-oxoglutarate/2-oxoacid ferredoxin oxidoreductase subunit alpha